MVQSRRLTGWPLALSMAIGLLALWVAAAPVLGNRIPVTGGSFTIQWAGDWFGCAGSCSEDTCAATYTSHCTACDGENCVGGAITIISASVGDGHVISTGSACCTPVDERVDYRCGQLQNASCYW